MCISDAVTVDIFDGGWPGDITALSDTLVIFDGGGLGDVTEMSDTV